MGTHVDPTDGHEHRKHPRDPHEAERERDRDDAGDRGDEDDVPRGEARARLRYVAAQDRALLARARSLADREIAGDLVTHDPLDDQLHPGCDHDPYGDAEVAHDDGDHDAREASDDQIPQLHREPQDRIEPVRKSVDPAKDGDLSARDAVVPRRQ